MLRKPPAKTKRKPKPPKPGAAPGNRSAGVQPQFAEPVRTPNPVQFVTKVTDKQYYKLVDPLTTSQLIQAVPPPRDPGRLLMSLADAYGSSKLWADRTRAIKNSKQIVFHAVGDTGPTNELKNIEAVADKMCADFQEANAGDIPAFFYHLGDVVYNFGEAQYYYDQFYEPFRNYNAPIFAIAGNHDGEVYPSDPEGTLQAFLANFCSPAPTRPPRGGGLSRTTMTQPGVYFALDAPFVRIIGLYSNVLEDPGVISSENGKWPRVGDGQLAFLKDQLKNCSNYKGAIIVAIHHPPVVVGSRHGSSPRMLQDLDACFKAAGVYPHAVLSGHAHNYQRFTRIEGARETPYVVAGMGGHNAKSPFSGNLAPPRPPFQSGQFRCENYSTQYGYLRVVVTSQLLSIQFHDVTTGMASKAPADVVTVDLATHRLTAARP